MKYAMPIKSILSVVDNGITYTKECYKSPTIITGVADENYAEYVSTTTYAVGQYVIISGLKTIYKCAVSGAGNFPADNGNGAWQDYGFVNSYRMFSIDTGIGAVTTGTDIYMEFDFNRLDTIGMLDISFISVEVEQIDNDTDLRVGEILTISGKDIGTNSFSGYFYDEIGVVTRVIEDNLEWLPNSTLKLTFSGVVEIGTMVSGLVRDLFVTLYDTELSFQDKSKISTNAFTGTREVIRYGHIRKLNAKALFEISEFNLTCQKVAEIIGKNILAIPTKRDDFNEMTNIVYIESFPLPINNPEIIQSTITMIGVPK